MSWKQRLYAFLLRRILGPYLAEESLQRMHESLNVSLQDGRFALGNIQLNPTYLTEKMGGVRVIQAKIKNLQINLSLRESGLEQEDTSAFTTMAWRAMNLGREPSVSLVASVEIEGVEIVVGPGFAPKPPEDAKANSGEEEEEQQQQPPVTESAPSTTSSMVSSYVDAALASLKMSLSLKDVLVRIVSTKRAEGSRCAAHYVQFHLASASYRDLLSPTEGSSDTEAKKNMQKRLDFGGILVETGEFTDQNEKEKKALVGRLNAGGQVSWLISTPKMETTDETTNRHVQQDIEVRIHPQLQTSIDQESIVRLLKIAKSFQEDGLEEDSEPPPVTLVAVDEDDEQDVKVVRGIMEQYLEARSLAEKNQLRGGILVPNDADEDDGMSFDAFFDANDQSFANYKSVLEESLMLSRPEGGNDVDQIHTRIKFHLGECSLKLSFLLNNPLRTADYILCSFGDLNVVTSVSSSGSSDINASVGHWEIEASHILRQGSRPEIISLLHFDSDDDIMNSNMVSLAPCVDINIEKSKRKKETETKIDLRLQPIHILCHPLTIQQATQLMKSMTDHESTFSETIVSGPIDDKSTSKISLSVWSPSIEAMVPLESSQEHEPLFDRCGYELEGMRLSPESFIGLTLEDVVLSDEFDGHKFACQRAVVFAMAPLSNPSKQMVEMMRVDVIALSGLHPISVSKRTLSQVTSVSGGSTVATSGSFFPKFPAVSTFKARQEDDDYHDEFSEGIVNALKLQDPQPGMLRLADRCSELLGVHIPDITVDLTGTELKCLAVMAKAATSKFSSSSSEGAAGTSMTRKWAILKGISVTLDQLTMCSHEDPSEANPASFKVIGSRWEFCAVLQESNLRCARIAIHSMDFYYAENLLHTSLARDLATQSIQDRCNAIRHRTVRKSETRAIPVLYRSQLFSPLSPESPALQLDIVNKSTDDQKDMNVFFTLYNLTHRLNVDSDWIERLKNLCVGATVGKETCDEDNSMKTTSADSIIKVFASVADCNVDYSTSPVFDRASRSIIRVSDIRMSSTFVSPTGPFQTIRVSLGDLSFLICDNRHPYNAENSRLSRSATILPPEQIDALSVQDDVDGPLGMGLITILTLDSIVSLITVASSTISGEPKTAVSINCGQLCLYGCKDSFACFTDTLSELLLKFTALDKNDVEKTKAAEADLESHRDKAATVELGILESGDLFYDSQAGVEEEEEEAALFHETAADERIDDGANEELQQSPFPDLSSIDGPILPDELPRAMEKSIMLPTLLPDEFTLDGYDWTTVDHDWSKEELPAGEEQVARWYSDHSVVAAKKLIGERRDLGYPPVRIDPHYLAMKSVIDVMSAGDMDAAKHAGLLVAPSVNTRVLLRNLSVRIRFFDGYDWPQHVHKEPKEKGKTYTFLISEPDVKIKDSEPKIDPMDHKSKLMTALLDGESGAQRDTFRNIPTAEERGKQIRQMTEQRRLSRKTNRSLQVLLSRIKCRLDSFTESPEHRLASCTDLIVDDLFVSESVSNAHPTKLMGEWVNENEHPRDTGEGLVMLKMVTWKPKQRITDDDNVANDESQGTLRFLPLRCHIFQRTIQFMSAFFANEDTPRKWANDLKGIPPPLFKSFLIKRCKLKVNYSPEKMDIDALRDGSIVELINLSPLNDMVILLQPVLLDDKVGFGQVFGSMAKGWIQDICATQLYKFVTNASAVQPISSVVRGAADMVILPVDAWKKDKRDSKSVVKAVQTGVSSFAGSLAYETLNVTAKVTGYAAKALNGKNIPHGETSSRPTQVPRTVWDTTNHALDSMTRGLEAANYKVVVVPYREYQRRGATGAAKSIIRGIPVAILAPVGAASEAVSYTLLGARNQLRPEVRREEEATQRGLHAQHDPNKF